MVICDATIAVLLATYNGEQYISQQLDSLLNQSYQDFNIYIHDDGSKDRTLEIVKSYCQKYPNKIYILGGPSTGGAKNNFFYLMQNVDSQYYMFCDQDDYWKEDKVEKSFNAIKGIEQTGNDIPLLAFTDLEVVNDSLETISLSMNKLQKLNPYDLTINKIMCQNPITGCTIIINKKANQLSLRYKEINNIIMHDWWIAFVVARYGRVAYCDEPLIKYRQHGDNAVGAYNPNNPGYIKKKVFQISYLKDAIESSRVQAREFCSVFGINGNDVIDEFANIGQKPKHKRLWFYVKNRTWKNGLIRNIGFVILG